jgi:hypothetical protein
VKTVFSVDEAVAVLPSDQQGEDEARRHRERGGQFGA